jgi:outer membrane protein assembly factor BamB
MNHKSWRRLFVLFILSSSAVHGQTRAFVDPAPPAQQKPNEIAPPAPNSQPGLKFHGAPRPLAPGAVTHDWRTFLGPAHNGISTEAPLVKTFPKTGLPIVWEARKGEGYAAPAVIGDRVVVFHRVENEEIIECLQAETGRQFWRHAYPTAFRDPYGWSGGPRCPPISDGDRVYTFGAEGKLTCLKLTTGQVLWKRDIVKEFKRSEEFFGVGATPLLEGGLLIVNVGADDGPCVAAFDKLTGKMVWGAGTEWGASYASPIPSGPANRRRVFVFAGGKSRPPTGGLLCIDPATGKVDFNFPWRARSYESVNASSPVVLGSQVYISECYGRGAALLNLQPDGSAKEAWTNNVLQTHFMTAIHKDGYLYGIDGHGPQNAPLVCIELKTGKEMWRVEPEWENTVKTAEGERKFKLSQGLASLMLVDGRCLMLSEYGHLVWLDLNPKAYHELDRTLLFLARETWGMPALSRGLLYVCQNNRGLDGSQSRIICYDLRGEKK